jgi:hypothetical protein
MTNIRTSKAHGSRKHRALLTEASFGSSAARKEGIMQHSRRPRASPAEPLIALLVIVVALGVFALAWFVPAHARLVAEIQERECRAHLQAIYQAIQHYRTDHHGQYPDSLVEPPQLFHRQPPITHLAPHYLAASQLLCAVDEGGGVMLGWKARCSYLYGLQELMSHVPEVRRRVQSGLIQRYGPKLRLITCPSVHRIGPVGFLTLDADGRIYKELIHPNDPQNMVHRSLRRLETASLSKRPARWATAIAPAPKEAVLGQSSSPP